MNEYIAFISYRHMPLDTAVAKRLHRLIERYRIPAKLAAQSGSRTLGRVFRDQDELPVSSDLSASIREALDHTRFLIVVCTPDTPQSVWVQREIAYFLEHHDRDHVLVVLAAGRPEEAFADRLVHIYDAEGNVIGDAEPLAANIVGGSQREVLRRLDIEKLRLFAALIGCSYDALYQRERRYRLRRLTAAAAVVALAASSFIALLLVKNRQITARNEALTEQKRQVQLSESALLTKNALDALGADDAAGGIRSALAALPDGPGDDRPYYAPAERVLLSALQVYDLNSASTAFVAETEVSLPSPVSDFALSPSADALYAADEYGGVAAFDLATGKALWRTSEALNPDSVFTHSDARLMLTEDVVIDACGGTISGFDRRTGEALWQRGAEIFLPTIMALSEDGERLALMDYHSRFTEDWSMFKDYSIDVLDTHTGEAVCSVPMASLPEDRRFDTSVYEGAHDALRDALFVDGGRRFIGSYQDSSGAQCLFSADLEAGTLSTLLSWPVDLGRSPLIGLCADPSEENLYIFRRSGDTDIAATCVKVALDSGEVLWEAQTPADEDYHFSGDMSYCLLMAHSKLLLGAKDRMYALDMETGETVASVSLKAPVAHMFSLDGDRLFGFVLQDGYYAVGWLNDHGFYDSRALYGTYFNLGGLKRAASVKQGFLRPVIQDGGIQRFDVGDLAQGYGAIVAISEEDAHALRIKSLLPPGDVTSQRTIPFPEEGWFFSGSDVPGLMLTRDGALLSEERYIESNEVRRVFLLDPESGRLSDPVDYHLDLFGEPWLLPDGSGVMLLDYEGGVSLYGAGAEEATPLAVALKEELQLKEDLALTVLTSACHADYQEEDSSLLTAWCDGGTLRWWRNAQEQPSVTLPASANWSARGSIQDEKRILVSEGGVILLSDYDPELKEDAMRGFIAFDTHSGDWYTAPDEAHGGSGRLMAVGKARPLLAVMDADRALRIYDLAAGQLERALPIDLPPDYLEEIQFAFADRWLMLRMADGQLALFDLETGECAFRGELEKGFLSDTDIVADRSGHRAYFIDRGIRKGLVLDMDTWQLLAELENVCAFDPRQDELYFVSYKTGLVARQIPDLDTLIQTGRKLVSRRIPELDGLTQVGGKLAPIQAGAPEGEGD